MKMKFSRNGKKAVSLLLSAALIITGSGIAGKGASAAKKATVKLSKSKLTLKVGKSASLKLKKKNVKSAKISWKSSKKAVASVNKKGKVTAKKAGKATISAKVKYKAKGSAKTKTKTLKCKVTVKETDSGKTPAASKAPSASSTPAPSAKASALPTSSASASTGDNTKPSSKPGDDTKPSSIPGDDTKPSATPGDDTKPSSTPGDDTKPSSAPGDDTKPSSAPGDDTKPGSTPGDDTKPSSTPGDDTKPSSTPGDDTKPSSTPGDDTKPGSTPGDDTKPGSTPGDDTNPGTTPGDNTNPGTTPGDNTNPGTTPGDNTPGTTPGDTTPGTTPGDNTPGTTPGDNTPGTTPGDTTPGTTPGDNTPGTTPGDNTPGTTPGDDTISSPALTITVQAGETVQKDANLEIKNSAGEKITTAVKNAETGVYSVAELPADTYTIQVAGLESDGKKYSGFMKAVQISEEPAETTQEVVITLTEMVENEVLYNDTTGKTVSNWGSVELNTTYNFLNISKAKMKVTYTKLEVNNGYELAVGGKKIVDDSSVDESKEVELEFDLADMQNIILDSDGATKGKLFASGNGYTVTNVTITVLERYEGLCLNLFVAGTHEDLMLVAGDGTYTLSYADTTGIELFNQWGDATLTVKGEGGMIEDNSGSLEVESVSINNTLSTGAQLPESLNKEGEAVDKKYQIDWGINYLSINQQNEISTDENGKTIAPSNFSMPENDGKLKITETSVTLKISGFKAKTAVTE